MSDNTIISIEDYKIELSNLDKVLFPKSGLTKRDLIFYYKDIALQALPLYKDRPLTMLRCPDGIEHQNFLQKEAPAYLPEWIDRFKVAKKGGHVTHILVNKQATFVYLANQACISFHLALSTIDKIHYPRYLLFDLAPSSEDIPLLKGTLKRVKELLDYLGLDGFLQTTGSRGFHIYVPLKRVHSFDKTHDFAKKFANYLAQEYSQDITVEQSKAKRGKRVFIDYARNSYGINAIGPYSVRPNENGPVATPLHWDELNDPSLHSQTYNMKTIFKRFSEIDDPWKNIQACEFTLDASWKKLEELGQATV